MVVLATKVTVGGAARDRAIKSLEALVSNDIGELEVEYSIGVRDDDFPSVTVSGEDATAARNVLRANWGEITDSFEADETYIGTLDAWDPEGFVLDAGTPVRIPADELGLGPGRPDQLVERFGLVQHLRLQFDWGDPPTLASAERDRLFDWRRGPGRITVNNATRGEVRATVNRAGHAEDIVTVERLGLLEQSIVCAEGTDPPGLLSAIGDYLPAAMRCVIPD